MLPFVPNYFNEIVAKLSFSAGTVNKLKIKKFCIVILFTP